MSNIKFTVGNKATIVTIGWYTVAEARRDRLRLSRVYVRTPNVDSSNILYGLFKAAGASE